MGGSSEFKIGDLRVHESGGEVHVHDDKKGLRFVMPVADFKGEYDNLKAAIEDGVVKKATISSGDKTLRATEYAGRIEWALTVRVQGFAEFDDFVSKI